MALLKDLQPYKYQTLGNCEIRVLMLENGHFGQPLRAHFEIVTLGYNFELSPQEMSSVKDLAGLECFEILPPQTVPLRTGTNSFPKMTLDGEDAAKSCFRIHDYCALSYAWGSADRPYTIQLHQNSFVPITASLYQALQHFRGTQTVTPLWADALCINQADNEEKARQVAFMGAIYRCARSVRVWLGESDGLDWIAFAMLDEMRNLGYPRGEDGVCDALALAKHKCQCRPALSFRDGREAYGHALAGLQALLDRPWFQRLWVVQEVHLSTAVCVQSGEHQTHFQSLTALGEWALFSVDLHPLVIARLGQRRLDMIRHFRRKELWPLSFISTMSERWSARCAVPHDRIYAVRWLARDCSWIHMKPDYSIEISALFRRVTVSCLEHDHKRGQHPSALLALAQYTRDGQGERADPRWPTWLPDYHRFSPECEPIMYSFLDAIGDRLPKEAMHVLGEEKAGDHRLHGLRLGGRISGTICRMLGDSELATALAGCDLTLLPHGGLQVNTVHDRGSIIAWLQRCSRFLRAEQDERCRGAVAEEADHLTRSHTAERGVAPRKWNRRRSEAFLPAVDKDHLYGLTIIDDSLQTPDRANLRNFIPGPLSDKNATVEGAVCALLATMGEYSPYGTQSSHIEDSILSILGLDHHVLNRIEMDRVLASLKIPPDRVYFGWVPKSARRGDAVSILYGSMFPFVLRKSGDMDAYEIVGHALFPTLTEEAALGVDVKRKESVLLV